MTLGDKAAIDFIKPAMYLINKLHPLYINLAQSEKVVYKSIIGKKSMAKKTIGLYDKILGHTAEPLSEVSNMVNYTVNQGRDYAESVVTLYRLFVALNESRIAVLNEFINHGMSEQIYSLNKDSLSVASDYDKLFLLVREQTESLYSIFEGLGFLDKL